MEYTAMNAAQLQVEYGLLLKEFENLKAKGLKLDMSRGKPGSYQLDQISDIFDVFQHGTDLIEDGVDTRNYGELTGLRCAKVYFSSILGCKPEEILVGGNASLTLMYDTIAKAYTHGMLHSEKPWSKLEKVKFLCPAPGYDRHFKICEHFGMEMITIPMTDEGPDMDEVEKYITDPAVKGIWCVPKYSNPDGIIYSDEVIGRLASMKPAAADFLLMWDNAYCVHEFDGPYVPFPDILSLCRKAGNPDMVFEFASTSKITLPGAGVAVMACSEENMKHIVSMLTIQCISYDKINQLRHARYLKDLDHTLEIMQRHAAVMKPKFDAVLQALDTRIAPLGIAQWKRPKGGYFISVNTMDGLAKRTLELCREAGVVMTPAGATFPYGVDPRDRNIRIAPSYPSVEELELAIAVFCTCLQLAAVEKLMAA